MFTLGCDHCGAVTEKGEGSPSSLARRRIYCPACSQRAAQVEAVLRQKATEWAIRTSQDLDAERERLMREFSPAAPSDDEPRSGIQMGWPVVSS